MNKDLFIYLEDIFESIQKIEKYVNGISKEQFQNDDELQDAVIRRFAIIGEAANKIPKEFKNQYPDVPWKEMVGMRNILIHAYSEADLDGIWDTIINDLPDLKDQIARLKSNNL